MDRRRLAAAALSAVLPGLGPGVQPTTATGRALRLAVRSALLLAALVLVQSQSPARLVAWIVGAGGARRPPDPQPAPPRVAAAGRRPGVPGHPPPGANRTARDRRDRASSRARRRPAPGRLSVRQRSWRDVRRECSPATRSAGSRGQSGPLPADGERINVLLVGRRRQARSHRDPDRHDDGRLARPGRTLGLAALGAARPHRHAARQWRRLRPKLNSLLGYADRNPDAVSAGRHARARGRGRRVARHPDPLLREARFRSASSHGRLRRRCGRDRAHGFEDPGYDGFGFDRAAGIRSRPATSPRRAERAGIRAIAQGRRRE